MVPVLSAVERPAWETRRQTQEPVFRTLVADLDKTRLGRLDRLLVVPESGDATP